MKTSAERMHHLEIQKQNYALKEHKEENNFLFFDLNSIQDPHVCAYIQAQQLKIISKRNDEQQDQQAPSHSTPFEQYFTDFERLGSDLPFVKTLILCYLYFFLNIYVCFGMFLLVHALRETLFYQYKEF